MKDTRFIELVNLYIDRQITAEETAELEAQIQANAKHRQIYQQYCRMHRATTQVFDSFRTSADAPALPAVREAGSIARFQSSRRSPVRWYYAAAGVAAAACMAVVVAQHRRSAAHSEVIAANDVPAQAAIPAPEIQVAATPETPAAVTMAEQQLAALLAAKRQEEIRAFALNQQKVTKPISLFEDGESLSDGALLTVDGKVFFSRKKQPVTQDETTEFTAFQYQR